MKQYYAIYIIICFVPYLFDEPFSLSRNTSQEAIQYTKGDVIHRHYLPVYLLQKGMYHTKIKLTWRIILIPCTVHLLLFCTMNNKCTIISQIITPLHVSTLSCHPQTACDQYLAKLHQYFKCSCR